MDKIPTPLADRVIIRQVEPSEAIGHIIVPDIAKEKPHEGVVLAVGPGIRKNGELVPLSVKVGDHVLYGKFDGMKFRVYPYIEDIIVLREKSLMSIVQNKK